MLSLSTTCIRNTSFVSHANNIEVFWKDAISFLRMMGRRKPSFAIQCFRGAFSDLLFRSGYKRLNNEDDEVEDLPSLPPLCRRRSVLVSAMLAFCLLFLWFVGVLVGHSKAYSGFIPVTPNLYYPGNAKYTLAMYSPYFPVAEYKNPPRQCKIDQVNIVSTTKVRVIATNPTIAIDPAARCTFSDVRRREKNSSCSPKAPECYLLQRCPASFSPSLHVRFRRG